MGRRPGRAAAKRAAAALESTPKTFAHFDEDEPMAEASPDPQPEAEEEVDKEDSENEEAKEDIEDEEEEESHKSPTPPPEPVIRRKRLGRPPKNKPPDWDLGVPVTPGSENTPRRRGRGGWRGRGGRKGQPAAVTQQAVDKEGTMVEIVNDELDLPEDAVGETKVDKMGNLQGDREYRCRTFTVLGRGNRLYMLSTEPARCVGFRDSYLFFNKHRKLCKIIIDDDEKKDMIERDIIPHSYKGRTIGVVTARSVFREFGSLIVVGGRRIVDDYDVAQAKADGAVEGELADPNDHFELGKPYNKNQYVAWHGASAVYHTAAPVVPQQSGTVPVKKKRVAINDINWMMEHSRDASRFNSDLRAFRKLNLQGVYNVHTNANEYPASMQPTNARVEVVPVAEDKQRAFEDDLDDFEAMNIDDDNGRLATASSQHLKPETQENMEVEERKTIFTPLPPKVAKNFIIHDVSMETPPAGIAPAASRRLKLQLPAAKRGIMQGFHGLSRVEPEIRDMLPAECRAAFDTALAHETAWEGEWGTEAEQACRREPIIDKALVPFSML